MAHGPSIMASVGEHQKQQKILNFFKRPVPGFGKGYVLATNVDTGEMLINPDHTAMHSNQPGNNSESPLPATIIPLNVMWVRGFNETEADYTSRMISEAENMVSSLRKVGCHVIAYEHECPDPLDDKSSLKQICVALPDTRLEMRGEDVISHSNLGSLPQFVAYFLYKEMVRPEQVQHEFDGKMLASAIKPEIIEQFQKTGADLPGARYYQEQAQKLFPKTFPMSL